MPPPRGTFNPLEGPADYDMTTVVHSDTYAAIDPAKADFQGKAVFISGASRGIGRAMAVSFTKAGAAKIALGARSGVADTVEAMRKAADQVGKPLPQIILVIFDVSDYKSVDGAAQKVRAEFGRIDIIVNNAGVLNAGLIADSDPEEWTKCYAVNVFGPYYTARAFIPLMLEGGDKTIVTVGSVGGLLTTPGLSAYQSSKLAVLRLTEFISADYGAKGVLSYTIHPGNILTDMGESVVTDELRPVLTETAELSADSVVYLTSEKRDWLAGRYINVTWDLPELVEKKKAEIVSENKLKLKLVV